MTENIYLVGFMGSGKSTVGRLVAQTLNRPFLEMDDVLEKEFGQPIREVFDRLGEDVFRARETKALRRLSRQERQVVATGGGVVISDQNRELMRGSGTMVYLEANFDSCRARLGESEIATRPLWRDKAEVSALLDRRRPALRGKPDQDRHGRSKSGGSGPARSWPP